MSLLSTARASIASRPPNVRFWITLAAIALVGFGVRLAFALTADIPEAADPRTYHFLAINLVDGIGYVRPPQFGFSGNDLLPTAEFPPLFPALLTIPTWLGLRSMTEQAAFMCFVGTGAVVLIGMAGRRFANARVGIVAALIAALHPLIFQPASLLMSEGLYLVILSGILLAAHAAVREPERWQRWLVLGLLIGLAALTRTEALLLPLVLVLPLIARRGQRTVVVRACAVALAASAVVVVPWTIRNAVEFGRFVPVSTNTGTVTLGANCSVTYSGRSFGGWNYACIAGFAGTQGDDAKISADGRNEAEVYDSWRAAGIDYATDHPGRAVLVAGARVLRTWSLWNPSAILDFDVLEGRDRTLQTVGYVLGLLLLPFAIFGARVLWRARGWRVTWILVAPAVVATLVSIVGFGSTRLRVVAEPSLAVLAAVGLCWAFARTRGGSTSDTSFWA